MRRYLVPVLVFLLLSGGFLVSGEQTGKIADNYPFETALELSRILDRQFVFTFVSEDCSHCQDFKEEILSDPEVREMLNNHFVLSLVTLDETFKIELPERGELRNTQLASGLGVKGTPMTFVYYPPDPGLLQEGRGITRFPGNPPDPETMIDFLERIVTESFKEEEEEEGEEGKEVELTYYNYSPAVKEISEKDFNIMEEASVGIPVLTEKIGFSSLPDVLELIVNFSGESVKEYSRDIISETNVEKVYLVEG